MLFHTGQWSDVGRNGATVYQTILFHQKNQFLLIRLFFYFCALLFFNCIKNIISESNYQSNVFDLNANSSIHILFAQTAIHVFLINVFLKAFHKT